jgi:tetratricopeptide (TPR) repeat protein
MVRMSVDGWKELAALLAALSQEERDLFARYTALNISGDVESAEAALRTFASENPESTPATLLATAAARVARERSFAIELGEAALSLSDTDADRQLAHVCLAQVHFQNRREQESLAAFEEHCRNAIELGHAGTFCYERLATLYEYRGDRDAARRVSRRALEALEAAGDRRAAERFRKRLERLTTP